MIRVFPKKNNWIPSDELAFIGDPPMEFLRPPEQPVYISVTFTWDIREGQRLKNEWSRYYKNVYIGGVAFGDLGNEFIPGRFIKEGVTFTSRGCPKRCSWCHVPRREGSTREIKIMPGHIIQDNNILACSKNHIKKVFAMLKKQNKGIIFSGGLDASRFKGWHRELIDTIKIKELWFACDSIGELRALKEVSELVKDISINKKRCYVLMGFKETLSEAESRVKKVYALEFLPFAQLYRGNENNHYSVKWRKLARLWARPAAYRSHDK